MVYTCTQDVPIGPEHYQGILDEIGLEPLAGALRQRCVRPATRLRYINVGQSQELCATAPEQRIHSAADRAFGGARPTTQPVAHPLDVVNLRGALLPTATR